MKKLLYVSFENAENCASGVNKKINGQIKAFNAAGFSTDLIARYQDNLAFYQGFLEKQVIKAVIPWRIALCSWAAEHAREYDIAYIRFQFFCPFVLNMVKAFYREGVKTIMEIPTYPYEPELKKQGKVGLPKLLCDRFFRGFCVRYIDRFASPLYDQPIYGKTCIDIRNGINIDEIEPRKIRKNDGSIHLLAVAMMAPWHGYDRLIEGLHAYYSKGETRKVVLHLVGEGAATPEYKELVQKYRLENYVIFHGKMYGELLEQIYNNVDIGVSSIGTHRKNVFRSNTLKVLEYIAKGLPVICEAGEIGIDKSSKYRMTIAANDFPVDICSVVEFYDSIYNCKEDAKDIVSNLRKYCHDECSIKKGMSDVITFFH